MLKYVLTHYDKCNIFPEYQHIMQFYKTICYVLFACLRNKISFIVYRLCSITSNYRPCNTNFRIDRQINKKTEYINIIIFTCYN